MKEKYLYELKIGTIKMFTEFFKKETNKQQRANMWTFIRLIIPFITITLSIIALKTDTNHLLIFSFLMALFGAVTDFYDGRSSRKYNSVSEYGKILDQITDKVFSGAISINLLFLNFYYIFILLGEAIITLVNIYYKKRYPNISIISSKIGKIKQFPLFVTLAIGYISPINVLIYNISIITIIITFILQIITAINYYMINKKDITS